MFLRLFKKVLKDLRGSKKVHFDKKRLQTRFISVSNLNKKTIHPLKVFFILKTIRILNYFGFAQPRFESKYTKCKTKQGKLCVARTSLRSTL